MSAPPLLDALAWSWPTDRIGPKRVVMVTLCQWAAVAVAAYIIQTRTQFEVLAILARTGLGAVQAASRTLLTTLIPRGREAELFGFYALCGKSAAIFVGPLVFGTISHAAGGDQRARHPRRRHLLHGGACSAGARAGQRVYFEERAR